MLRLQVSGSRRNGAGGPRGGALQCSPFAIRPVDQKVVAPIGVPIQYHRLAGVGDGYASIHGRTMARGSCQRIGPRRAYRPEQIFVAVAVEVERTTDTASGRAAHRRTVARGRGAPIERRRRETVGGRRPALLERPESGIGAGVSAMSELSLAVDAAVMFQFDPVEQAGLFLIGKRGAGLRLRDVRIRPIGSLVDNIYEVPSRACHATVGVTCVVGSKDASGDLVLVCEGDGVARSIASLV